MRGLWDSVILQFKKSFIDYWRIITSIKSNYNPSIVDKALFKLRNCRISHPSYSNHNINIILPFFPNSSFSIAKILKQKNFKVIFCPTNKLSHSKLKDLISFCFFWKSSQKWMYSQFNIMTCIIFVFGWKFFQHTIMSSVSNKQMSFMKYMK